MDPRAPARFGNDSPEVRLLEGLVREVLGISWNEARRAVVTGKISVDGLVVTDPKSLCAPGAALVFDPAAHRPRAADELDDDAVVYLDEHLIVVEKPAGLMTVPFERHDLDTLDRRVRAFLSRRGARGERGPRPSLGVVQRLDKDTSGILVFARTFPAKEELAAQLRAHTVHRRYLALVYGAVQARTFATHLIEDRGDGRRGSLEHRYAPRGGKRVQGKLAVTHVEPVERLTGATLVSCRLETGRTHQIRIHLAEVGHPLLGEDVYVPRGFAPVLPAPRQMLHAAELGFDHPASGVRLYFRRDPPLDMSTVLERLRASTARA